MPFMCFDPVLKSYKKQTGTHEQQRVLPNPLSPSSYDGCGLR